MLVDDVFTTGPSSSTSRSGSGRPEPPRSAGLSLRAFPAADAPGRTSFPAGPAWRMVVPMPATEAVSVEMEEHEPGTGFVQ